jgi:hypothetical protein
MNVRAKGPWCTALALTAVVGVTVLLVPDIALAATASRLPKTLWSALANVAGTALFFLGFPLIAGAIYLAVRRTWVAVGIPTLAVLPLSVIFQSQNPAITSLFGRLLAIAVILLAVGALAAIGMRLAKALINEAGRIGAAATALAMIMPVALAFIGPVGGFVSAGMVDQVPPNPALGTAGVPIVGALLVLAFALGRLLRSVASTTIGTGVGLFVLSLWPAALSNAVDAGQGMIVVFLLIPLVPLALLMAWAGAKLANARGAD